MVNLFGPLDLTQQARRINWRVVFLFLICAALSTSLGFSIENIFSLGFTLELSSRFLLPLFLLVFFTAFLTAFSLVASAVWRWGVYFLATLGFSFPFFPFPAIPSADRLYLLSIPLVYLVGFLLFDRAVQGAVKKFAIFSAKIFSDAYSKIFLALVIIVGILVFYTTPAGFSVKAFLGPFLDPIVDTVFQQLGIPVGEAEKELVSSQVIAEVERFLGPFLRFLPFVFAIGTALSLLALSPLINFLTVFTFAVVYRLLVLVRLAQFVVEQREVRVLKLA